MVFEIMTGGIAVLVVILAVIAIPQIKKQREIIKKTGKYPKGYFLGQGMGLGMALGIPLGVGIGNIAIGPALGLPIGVAIGQRLEKKYKDKIRPMTDEEKVMRRKMVLWGVATAVLGFLALLAFSVLV